MVQTFTKVQGERANSRKWKGFNRIILLIPAITVIQPILKADPAVVMAAIAALGTVYTAYAGSNAVTHYANREKP